MRDVRLPDEDELRHLEGIADWLDSRFRIPGTDIRFGLDSILGLFPGIGDAGTAFPAFYIVMRARRMGVPSHVLALMFGNIVLDLLLGAVPVLGDLFDVGFKANRRNLALLRKHYERRLRRAGP